MKLKMGLLAAALALGSGLLISDSSQPQAVSTQGHAISMGSVRGSVQDGHGDPIRDVRVRLIRYEDATIYFSDPVDVHGRYVVKDLPWGRFAVHVIWLGSGDVYPWSKGVFLSRGESKKHDIWIRPALP
jgi:hypothetical protein